MSELPPPAPPQTEPPPPRLRARPILLSSLTGLVVVILAAAIVLRGRPTTPSHYIGLSMLLFVTGAVGVLVRRNALVLFMCVELMLNAVNIAFVTFARMHQSIDGHVLVLFVMIVAAAEVAVGLAIIVSIFRRRQSANVDDLTLLRW